MKVSLDCMECNIKQLIKISNFVNASEAQQITASKKLFKMLSEVDFNKSNPEIMGESWKIIVDIYGNDNPYKEIKSFYNNLLLEVYDDIRSIIKESDNPFLTALKIAVIGNIIDFGARHTFSKEEVIKRIKNHQEMSFKKDDSKKFEQSILNAKTILYIGDNCGEIVLDKLFIETLCFLNKEVKVYFGVRGGAILNDVTVEDFNEVKMGEVATCVSSENAVPGTILKDSSKVFNDLFYNADVVIAKGQGNFESLSEVKRNGLYLLLMSKCNYVSSIIGVDTLDFVLIENR
jgi:uncharacterized protein with ATP-grasp and redox domains